MSQEQFDQVYQDFVSKLTSLSPSQRDTIFSQFAKHLNDLIVSTTPKSNGATPAVGVDADQAKINKQVEALEIAIGDRMHQLGLTRTIFQRYDIQHIHTIASQHFQAVVQQSLGIGLYPHEIQAFVNKYDTNGTGQINYDELLKVVESYHSQPRTTSQIASNQALLSRTVPGYDASSIIANVEQPLNIRLEKGLDALRHTMYMKSSNFYKLFQTLQNDNKKVSISDLVPQLPKLGFPSNLLSDSELESSITSVSQTDPGYLTYAEFLSFFMGHKSHPGSGNAAATQGYQPALLATLVKMNNLNLRKIFKGLDEDNDGLISTKELSQGLIEHGFPAGGASDPTFLEYIHSFSKRQQGTFGYAEFIKFVSHRTLGAGATKLDGTPMSGRTPIVIPEDYDINRIVDTMVTTRKQNPTAESVESLWSILDANDDGKVNEIEFFQGIAELGFQITHEQNQALFQAFDNGDGTVTIAEFARTLANPHRNSRLSTTVRHAPGGESSINLGSYVSPEAGKHENIRRASLKQVDTPHRAAHFTNVAVSDIDVNEDIKTGKQRNLVDDSQREKISLSFDVAEPEARIARPASRQNLEGAIDTNQPDVKLSSIPEPYQRVRQPPGGASSISFAADHGAPQQAPRTAPKNDLLSFDANAPVPQAQHVLRPPSANVVRSTLSLTHTDNEPGNSKAPVIAGPSTPSNRSSISFNQSDSETYRPLVSPMHVTGGESSIQLSHPETLPPSPSSYQSRPQDKSTIQIAHPEKLSEYEPLSSPIRSRKSVDGAPQDTLKLSHDSSRNDDDLQYAQPTHQMKRHHESRGKSNIQLSHDTPDVSAYKQEVKGEIDQQLLAQITKAIYAHSQRLRHTFQEFNHSQNPTLNKANFKNGITNTLKIPIPDSQVDVLFQRFDGDLDGEITYSEFVRMLATK